MVADANTITGKLALTFKKNSTACYSLLSS